MLFLREKHMLENLTPWVIGREFFPLRLCAHGDIVEASKYQTKCQDLGIYNSVHVIARL